MSKKRTFRKRIFTYFLAVFILFTAVVLLFQLNREKRYRVRQLENTLEIITDLTHNYIERHQLNTTMDFQSIDSIKFILPQENTRITIINKKGVVLYDSFVDDYQSMENHFTRPEIQKALFSGVGSNVRRSATTKQDFYYYAKYFDGYFIRTAVVYNIEIQNFLKGERLFIVFIVVLFLLVWILLHFVTKRLGETITKLKDFSIKAGKNEPIEPEPSFPDNELGTISAQIIRIYDKLKKAKDELSNEKERLFNHLNVLNEGIAFFSVKKEKKLANSHFIQFINMISEKSTISAENIFEIPELQPLNEFLDEHLDSKTSFRPNELPQLEFTVSKNEKYFKIQSIIFFDKTFEVLITDITRLEKRRLLKQQLTSNIAHELKTPLASIKGYLETVLNNGGIPKEKQLYFTEKAYTQTERLTYLLNDISLLNNIEDAGELFEFKNIYIRNLINDVIENLQNRFIENNITCNVLVDSKVCVNGNDSLISSIFQNLMENSINYAGKDIQITIKNYLEDERFHYFIYSDTGKGIPEEHLSRIFERFYRVDSGRTREAGGTGLGLSIVKNAIQLHKGEISVRNNPTGGLEFLFSLAKK